MLNKNTKYLPTKDTDGKLGEWKQCIFLKHFITKDFIEVGDYTYYDESFEKDAKPEEFENNNVLYFNMGKKLKIGKFCQIASKLNL